MNGELDSVTDGGFEKVVIHVGSDRHVEVDTEGITVRDEQSTTRHTGQDPITVGRWANIHLYLCSFGGTGKLCISSSHSARVGGHPGQSQIHHGHTEANKTNVHTLTHIRTVIELLINEPNLCMFLVCGRTSIFLFYFIFFEKTPF